jgi:hypothetical protein
MNSNINIHKTTTMNIKRRNLLNSLLLCGLFVVAGISCKKKFDQPPVYVPPSITANTTIRQLKALLTASGNLQQITDDLIIRGVVVGDDKSGNLYKNIVIQDATGGLSVLMEGTNLFTSYPIGREIFIKCKGLYLGDYNRLIQLGGGIDATGTTPSLLGIAPSLFNTYIVKGSFNNNVTPRVVNVSDLTTNLQDTLQNTLIQLNGFEFDARDTSKTYALPNQNPPGTVNFTIKNCTGASIVLRNSGYSNFAGFGVPNGNGNIVALYTVFGNTKQLTIRDTADLKLWGARCGSGGGGGGGGGGTGTLTDISAIRALLTGTTATIPADTKITGIVISDRSAGNTQSQNIVVQQGNGLSGIVVRFASATPTPTFNLGDSIDVVISGATLGRFQGVMQVSNVPQANVTRISTGKTITPRVATVAQVSANQPGWESTLVQILNVTISGGTGGNWSGTTRFADGTGTIDHFTRTGATGATFANTPYPTGVRASATAIVSKFNATNQIAIRNPSDVQ